MRTVQLVLEASKGLVLLELPVQEEILAQLVVAQVERMAALLAARLFLLLVPVQIAELAGMRAELAQKQELLALLEE